MSKDKTLLEEGTVRRFMKLANMEVIGTNFVNETFTTVDEEPVVEEEAAVYQDDEQEAVELDLDADIPADPAEDAEMEMDAEFDAEEALDEPEADAGELTLTDEEAEVFLKVADKVRAALDMGAPEELEAPDMGEPEVDMGEPDMPEMDMDADAPPEEEVEDAEEEVDMMENTVNEVARRIALRLQEMKKNSSK